VRAIYTGTPNESIPESGDGRFSAANRADHGLRSAAKSGHFHEFIDHFAKQVFTASLCLSPLQGMPPDWPMSKRFIHRRHQSSMLLILTTTVEEHFWSEFGTRPYARNEVQHGQAPLLRMGIVRAFLGGGAKLKFLNSTSANAASFDET
jgi:hypothetical protein